MVRTRLGIAIVAAVLGVGAALGAAACGEDREGDVKFEGGTTGGTTGGAGTVTAIATVTTPTETTPTETTPGNGGATAPETAPDDSGGAAAPAGGDETVEAEP
jgi:hypothetical protein